MEKKKKRTKERSRNKKPTLFPDIIGTVEEMPGASIHARSREAESELG